MKTQNCLKGQMTMINLLVILVVIFMFFAFLPILVKYTNEYAVPSIAEMTADQPTKDLTTALVQFMPVVIVLAIIITVLYYAIPRREGQ